MDAFRRPANGQFSARLFQKTSFFTFAICLFSFAVQAQNGCPGCLTNLPAFLPADTIFLENIPDGQQNQPFSADISFRMPKTTTPVNAVDSTTPAGFPISEIKILSVTGLPPGLAWTPSQTLFPVATETDGCIKICGTPLVADSFLVKVNLEATIFVLTKTATFFMKMYVSPEVSSTPGFSMTGFKSCGPTTVFFENNLPSGGQTGWNYSWDFGNGYQTSDENPPPQTYDSAGIYPVNYSATIDTAQPKLLTVNVLAVGCDDFGIPTAPDLYLQIKDETGQIIFFSGTAVNNVSLPHEFILNLDIEPGKNYSLEIWDEDSGLGGTDDHCGTINFTTTTTGGVIQNGALSMELEIFHPIVKIESTDTVFVFVQPEPPTVDVFPGLRGCEGDTIHLFSSENAGNQWFMNDQKIQGATDSIFSATQNGQYFVVFTTPDGCSATSEMVELSFQALPAPPVFYSNQNVLTLLDSTLLPPSYQLQWFINDSLSTDMSFDLCAGFAANFALIVTDLATGCTNSFESFIVPNPNVDCTTRAVEPAFLGERPFEIFPNPTSGEVFVFSKNDGLGLLEISVFTLGGARLGQSIFAENDAATGLSLDLSSLPGGLYFLKIRTPDGLVWVEKMAVVR